MGGGGVFQLLFLSPKLTKTQSLIFCEVGGRRFFNFVPEFKIDKIPKSHIFMGRVGGAGGFSIFFPSAKLSTSQSAIFSGDGGQVSNFFPESKTDRIPCYFKVGVPTFVPQSTTNKMTEFLVTWSTSSTYTRHSCEVFRTCIFPLDDRSSDITR